MLGVCCDVSVTLFQLFLYVDGNVTIYAACAFLLVDVCNLAAQFCNYHPANMYIFVQISRKLASKCKPAGNAVDWGEEDVKNMGCSVLGIKRKEFNDLKVDVICTEDVLCDELLKCGLSVNQVKISARFIYLTSIARV